MDKNKTTLFVIALYLVAIIVTGFSALIFNNDYEISKSNDYIINYYSVVANVKENNVIEITENITAKFTAYKEKHGIYRTLPLTASVGETNDLGNVHYKNFRYSYTDIKCNEDFDVYTSSGSLVIQIGNAYEIVSGKTITYQISYKIDLGSDRDSSKDSFYYNLIGTSWDAEILQTEITVNFPKSITSTPHIYVGEYGGTNEVSNYTFDGKMLYYQHNVPLDAGEGLTVKLDLEEGYFSPNTNYLWDIINLILLVIIALIAIVMFVKHSNKSILTPVVQFELTNLTSADAGYLIDRHVHDKDIASLIILWAQKGYLKIKEDGKNTYLIKVKEVDKNLKLYEKVLINKIFEKGDEVCLNNIDQRISDTITTVVDSIKVENKSSFNNFGTIIREIICIASSAIFTSVLYKIAYTAVYGWFMVLSFIGGIISYLLFKSFTANLDEVFNKKRKWLSVLALVSIITFFIVWFICCYDFYLDCFGCLIISIPFIILICFIVRKFNIRTDEGMKKLGDIVGLKTFIEVTEKDRLEMLVKDNPELFYEVLPYAYVFGIYDEWCKKFENIVIKTPSWVEGNATLLDFVILNTMIRSLMINFSSTLHLAQIVKGVKTIKSIGSAVGRSGGFGGGGFSGGGHGGGGGGSW